VMGSLRSRSNFWIAAKVSEPTVAGRLELAIAVIGQRPAAPQPRGAMR